MKRAAASAALSTFQDNWQLIADAQTSAAGTPDAKMTATVHRALAARVSWIRIRCAVAAGKLGSDFNQIQAPQRDRQKIGGAVLGRV
jgi:hypothetical protein